MKKSKQILLTIVVAAVIFASSIGVALAGNVFSPVEKLSELTGTSVEALYNQKGDKTFGQIATEKGVLDEFKKEMLENKKSILDQRVKDGTLTQKEADAYYTQIKENVETCDGSGPKDGERLGLGLGFGGGAGRGMGNGSRSGQGYMQNR